MRPRAPLERAMLLAYDRHAGQRYGSHPYIVHPLAVMEIIRCAGYPEPFQIVAVLHDTVEGTRLRLNVVTRLFGRQVSNAIRAVSKISGETHDDYLARVMADELATVVKYADSSHNLSGLLCRPTLRDWGLRKVREYERNRAVLAAVILERRGQIPECP